MEKQESIKPIYDESVDLMFQTYRKSLLDNIARTGELIKTCSVLESKQLDESVSLLHLLFNQLSCVNSFISSYSRLNEEN